MILCYNPIPPYAQRNIIYLWNGDGDKNQDLMTSEARDVNFGPLRSTLKPICHVTYFPSSQTWVAGPFPISLRPEQTPQ